MRFRRIPELLRLPSTFVASVTSSKKSALRPFKQNQRLKFPVRSLFYATMKIAEDGKTHYRGLYTTFLNGYILSLMSQLVLPHALKAF